MAMLKIFYHPENLLIRLIEFLCHYQREAFEYIDISIDCLKPNGGYLHFFSHIKSETKQNVISESEKFVHSLFSKYNYQIKHTQIVRAVGPRLYQTVNDIYIKK